MPCTAHQRYRSDYDRPERWRFLETDNFLSVYACLQIWPRCCTPAGDLFHGSITDIEAVAVYNEEKEEVTVFAVNRNLKEDVVLNTDVRSFEGYRVAEHIVLESDDLKVVNAFGQENVKPKTTQQTTMDNGELTSMLHKASWNVIRLVKDSK